MPVREHHPYDLGVLVFEHLLQARGPDPVAFAGVDEDALGALADEIGVGALEGEFAGVAAQDADDARAEALDVREVGEIGGHFADGGLRWVATEGAERLGDGAVGQAIMGFRDEHARREPQLFAS